MKRDDGRQKVESFGRAPALLSGALRQFPKKMWLYKPSADHWSIHEIILHLADSEASAYLHCRRFIAEPGSQVPEFDAARWASSLGYFHQSTRRGARNNPPPPENDLPIAGCPPRARVGSHGRPSARRRGEPGALGGNSEAPTSRITLIKCAKLDGWLKPTLLARRPARRASPACPVVLFRCPPKAFNAAAAGIKRADCSPPRVGPIRQRTASGDTFCRRG